MSDTKGNQQAELKKLFLDLLKRKLYDRVNIKGQYSMERSALFDAASRCFDEAYKHYAPTNKVTQLEQEVNTLLKEMQRHELRARAMEEARDEAQRETYKLRQALRLENERRNSAEMELSIALQQETDLTEELEEASVKITEMHEAKQALDNLRAVLKSLHVSEQLIAKIEKNEPPATQDKKGTPTFQEKIEEGVKYAATHLSPFPSKNKKE